VEGSLKIIMEKTLRKKNKKLFMVSSALYLAGFGYLFYYNWKLAIAVILVVTANNIEQRFL